MTSTIFISHSTPNKEVALAIIKFLRESGYADEHLFLDSDASAGLLVGQRWEEKLYQKLQDCVCLIVVGTPQWAASKWCFAEAFIAKHREIPIIPLIVDDQADLGFLSEYQGLRNFSATDDGDLSRLLQVLSQQELAPPGEDRPNTSGWTRKSPELSTQEQNDLLAQLTQQVGQFQPDRMTRRIVASILLILLVTITYVRFDEAIAKLLNPPKELPITTDDFIAAIKDKKQHEGLLEKKVELRGRPTATYSSSEPRIALDDVVEDVVEVNILQMANGEDPPASLPDEELTFTCVVDRVHPIEIEGETTTWIVHVVDFELVSS